MSVNLAKQIKNISFKDALEDYYRLADVDCKDINTNTVIGSKAMDYFFLKYRLKTKSRGGIDFITYYKTKGWEKNESSRRLYKHNIEVKGYNHTQAVYAVFRLHYGSINAFKPIVARELYCVYKPKTVLDFSAGWGGRCLACMAMNINYIGFDTNTNLRKPYTEMIKSFPTDSDIEIYFQDSSKADFSKFDYDFVFTSPPYYKNNKPLEKYQEMEVYKTEDEFYENFLIPVITNSYRFLKKGGHFALNIPVDMYNVVKTILGNSDKKYLLNIARRRPGTISYKEYIYVWNK